MKLDAMTDIGQAKRIGYMQALKAVTVGLAIAYLIMAILAGPLWLFEFIYTPTLLFAALVLYGAGYFFGRIAGRMVIISNHPPILVGLISGFVIIWSATFIGSLVGFFNEGLPNRSTISNPVEDYIFNPIMTVSLWGFLPIIMIGIWYGLSIKRKATKIIRA